MNRELPEGYTVRYKHFHGPARHAPPWCLSDADRWGTVVLGHSTTAVIFDPEGRAMAGGLAMCRPEDQFSKRLGRTIALGRALKQLERE